LLRCPPENWPADLFSDDDREDHSGQWNSALTKTFEPRSNIAPTQQVLGIIQASSVAPCFLRLFRWGLVPYWANDLKIGASMINARSETVDQKPSFKVLLGF